MNRTHWVWPAAIVASLAMVAVLLWLRPQPTPIPRAELRTLDSLAITQAAFDSGRAASVRVESVYVAQSAQRRASATMTTRAADSLHSLAIVAQRLAEAAHDSALAIAQWRDVATLRGVESDSLRAANTGLMSALEEQVHARTAADVRASDAEHRLVATSTLNDRLAADLRRADPPCRIVIIARCPSRRAAFVGGAIVASAGAYVITHRSSLRSSLIGL